MSIAASASLPTYADGYYMDDHLRDRIVVNAPEERANKRTFRVSDPAGRWCKYSEDSDGDELIPVFDAQEVRTYWPGDLEYPCVFIIRGNAVRTFMPMDDKQEAGAVLRGAVEECSACGGVHSYVTSNGCPYCNDEVRKLYVNN